MTPPLLLSRNEIDDERWNNVIKNAVQQVIYGYAWYLDVVCDQWKAMVWPSAEEYQIIMPLPVRQKWFTEVIEQPLFCQYLGLFSLQNLAQKEADTFLEAFIREFSYISSYHFNPSNTEILRYSLPGHAALQRTENTTFWLSLSDPYEQLLKKYTVDRKTNLVRSLSENWVVRKSEDIEPLIRLFWQNHASKIPGGIRSNANEILRKLYRQLLKSQSATLYYALQGNQMHSGVLIVGSGNHSIYLFNAADEAGRKGNARTYMLNKFFEDNAGSLITFDFESPEIPAIYRFYKSFGAVPVRYLCVKMNGLPFPFRQIQNFRLRLLS